MTVLQAVIMLLVALGGASVTLTRDPLRQVIVSGFYGLTLVVLFLVFQAPDVALSAVVSARSGCRSWCCSRLRRSAAERGAMSSSTRRAVFLPAAAAVAVVSFGA